MIDALLHVHNKDTRSLVCMLWRLGMVWWWGLYHHFVEIWNEHPVVDVNNAFVTCCLHANNSVLCLRSVTANKIQVSLVMGLFHCSEREDIAFTLLPVLSGHLWGDTVLVLYIHSWVTSHSMEITRHEWVRKYLEVVFQKALFQWSHTRLIQSIVV